MRPIPELDELVPIEFHTGALAGGHLPTISHYRPALLRLG